jgi:hypothetical protein
MSGPGYETHPEVGRPKIDCDSGIKTFGSVIECHLSLRFMQKFTAQ